MIVLILLMEGALNSEVIYGFMYCLYEQKTIPAEKVHVCSPVFHSDPPAHRKERPTSSLQSPATGIQKYTAIEL